MAWFLVHGYPIGSYGGMPDQGLPGYGRPDQGLPGWGGGPVDPGYGGGWAPPMGPGSGGGQHPGNWVPGSWGGRPDQGLPGYGHPGERPPGRCRRCRDRVCRRSCVRPDQGLPGSQPGPDQGSPGGGHVTGQPIVPGATPTGTAVATAPPEKVDAENGAWVLVSVQGTLVWAWAQQPKQSTAPDQGLPGGAPPTAGNQPGQTPQPKK